MKKSRWVCLLLALCLLLLPSCAQEKFDAASYVHSVLDSLYCGEHEQYREFTGITEEEAEAAYREHLKTESLYFAGYFGFEQSNETIYRTMAFYREVYQHSRYEVGEAERTDTGFLIHVEVSPLELFVSGGEAIENRVLAFSQRAAGGAFDGKTQEEIDREYCDFLLQFLEGELKDAACQEPVALTVRLEESQGSYVVNQEDLQALDRVLVPYDTSAEE